MSEEQIQQVENKEHNCCKKLLVLVIVSLLLSIASLGTSIYNMVNGGGEGGKKVVISKQYDKGLNSSSFKISSSNPLLRATSSNCFATSHCAPTSVIAIDFNFLAS